MAARRKRRRSSEESYDDLIGGLELSEPQRVFMRARWLDQLLWTERAARRAHHWYHALRLTTIIGALVVPALVGLNLDGGLKGAIAVTTFGVSLLVACCAGIDEFFRFGERWRHYRRVAEQLKSEGWSFFQLSGPYRRFNPHHTKAYPVFASRVEAVLQSDVEVYFTEVAQDTQEKEPD
jgi:Protein of unknown function (DUF4231)